MFRSSFAYSSRTRRTARSIEAALFSRTSSAIHRALLPHAFENAASFLVQLRVRSEHAIFESAARVRIGNPVSPMFPVSSVTDLPGCTSSLQALWATDAWA
ncbi:MAG TPA: hypothetical protein VG736_03415 [Vicinamibacterales bacterium]|jgi:hypothetical protein|nr:hypothetical protein [Vicinamibacterales bacterium]